MQAYNNTPHISTGFSPHFLLFGQEPQLPVDHLLGRTTTSAVATASAAPAGFTRQGTETPPKRCSGETKADGPESCRSPTTRWWPGLPEKPCPRQEQDPRPVASWTARRDRTSLPRHTCVWDQTILWWAGADPQSRWPVACQGTIGCCRRGTDTGNTCSGQPTVPWSGWVLAGSACDCWLASSRTHSRCTYSRCTHSCCPHYCWPRSRCTHSRCTHSCSWRTASQSQTWTQAFHPSEQRVKPQCCPLSCWSRSRCTHSCSWRTASQSQTCTQAFHPSEQRGKPQCCPLSCWSRSRCTRSRCTHSCSWRTASQSQTCTQAPHPCEQRGKPQCCQPSSKSSVATVMLRCTTVYIYVIMIELWWLDS